LSRTKQQNLFDLIPHAPVRVIRQTCVQPDQFAVDERRCEVVACDFPWGWDSGSSQNAILRVQQQWSIRFTWHRHANQFDSIPWAQRRRGRALDGLVVRPAG
jgi:hypothetical protein